MSDEIERIRDDIRQASAWPGENLLGTYERQWRDRCAAVLAALDVERERAERAERERDEALADVVELTAAIDAERDAARRQALEEAIAIAESWYASRDPSYARDRVMCARYDGMDSAVRSVVDELRGLLGKPPVPVDKLRTLLAPSDAAASARQEEP